MLIKYPKVMQLGDPTIDGILDGQVDVEEKIDGSQFRIFIDMDGSMWFGSKGVDFVNVPINKMFILAVEKATEGLRDSKSNFGNPVWIFAEYMTSPRHNTLSYERVPKNNLMIFDIKVGNTWLNHTLKEYWAKTWGFECAPLLFSGDGKELTQNKINELLKTPSFLGKETVEGIVVKNYTKYYDFNKFPWLAGMWMVGKYVREEFKELNAANWKKIKQGPVEALSESLANKMRYEKAWQHLRDNGQLENRLQDIPKLMIEVEKDILEEEGEKIKTMLWEYYWKQIKKGATRSIPEWYKQKLLEKI